MSQNVYFLRHYGLVSINAGLVRYELNHRQIVFRKVTAEDSYHGLIVGRKIRETNSKMARSSVLLVLSDLMPRSVNSA